MSKHEFKDAKKHSDSQFDSRFWNEDKYEDVTINLEKLKQDCFSIYKNITELFLRFPFTTSDKPAIDVHNNLIRQLIATVRFLVEITVVENNQEWAKLNFPFFKSVLEKLNANISAVAPDVVEEVKQILGMADKFLIGESTAELAFRWLENIFSLGGSILRDMEKKFEEEKIKGTATINLLHISDNNDLVLSDAENYHQYLRETTFLRDITPIIAVHNRLQTLEKIKDKEFKNPTENKTWQTIKQKLLAEQKRYEEKEAKLKVGLGEKRYSEIIISRQTRLQKMLARNDLDMFSIRYLKIIRNLYLEESKIHGMVAYQIDLLKKCLSKTLSGDKILVNYDIFKEQLALLNNRLQRLSELTQIQLESEQADLKDEKNGPSVNVSSVTLFPAQHYLLDKKFELADYKKISVIKKLREEYIRNQSILNRSTNLKNIDVLKINHVAYRAFISNAVRFFLESAPEKHFRLLFEVDLNDSFTSGEIRKKYRQLNLIFHTDKSDVPGADELIKRISETRDELLQHLHTRLVGRHIEAVMPKIAEGVLELRGWLESLLNRENSSWTSLTTNSFFNQSVQAGSSSSSQSSSFSNSHSS